MNKNIYNDNMLYLTMAGEYAKEKSGCTKVSVGSCIVKNDTVISMGANRTLPGSCKTQGCLRVSKYGNNSKLHRNPEDCRAIHSETDAICRACKNGVDLRGATIYVTRYPCEACARQIVSSGIKRVVYGREQDISELTKEIFEQNKIDVQKFSDYSEEDTEQ